MNAKATNADLNSLRRAANKAVDGYESSGCKDDSIVVATRAAYLSALATRPDRVARH